MKKYKESIVSYREKMKSKDAFTRILARIEVVREVLLSELTNIEISKKYILHRNSVTNLMNVFFEKVPQEEKDKLFQNYSFSKEEFLISFEGLDHKSTRPKNNCRQATKDQEKKVVKLHKQCGYASKRLLTQIKRTLDEQDKRVKEVQPYKGLEDLTLAKMKGIYKRNNLKPKVRKTASGTRIQLYNYEEISPFEHLHYDTKTITDLKALPQDIYDKFKNNPDLPVIEWNIIDAATRFRFIAYSHGRTSEFGFHFLVCVLQFIRGLFPVMRASPISVGMDNGAEFCLASIDKLSKWNNCLKHLNAKAWAYNPHWDIRKNLIERSHRTDDEEFFVPKGPFIKDRDSFINEARKYFIYFNARRGHDGIAMNGKTPIEKMAEKKIKNPEKLLSFPTMILEESIGKIKKNTEIIMVLDAIDSLKKEKKIITQKEITKISTLYNNFFSNQYAQNVLNSYLIINCIH